MEKLKNMTKLIEEIERISEIEKCLTCQCFYDTLMEFKEILENEKPGGDLKGRLSRLIEKSKVTHDCLGCDPCYPVPISNALHEMSGMAVKSACGLVCKPIPAPPQPSPQSGGGLGWGALHHGLWNRESISLVIKNLQLQ